MVSMKAIVDKIEFIIDDDGFVHPIAYKGRIIREHSFNHYFSSTTLKVMFFAQFDIDYCGG